MDKQTAYLIIGIGITSILAGVYTAYRTGEFMESVSGVIIGVALIGTVIIDRNKKDKMIKNIVIVSQHPNLLMREVMHH